MHMNSPKTAGSKLSTDSSHLYVAGNQFATSPAFTAHRDQNVWPTAQNVARNATAVRRTCITSLIHRRRTAKTYIPFNLNDQSCRIVNAAVSTLPRCLAYYIYCSWTCWWQTGGIQQQAFFLCNNGLLNSIGYQRTVHRTTDKVQLAQLIYDAAP